MPPFVLVIAAAALTARVLRREWSRVNQALDAAEAERPPAKDPEPAEHTLRRDPSGVWRPS